MTILVVATKTYERLCVQKTTGITKLL